jgi:formylglycine-generating enzyme required for sulfatase activity
MGRYPITQAQYEAVMGSNPATQYDSERFVAPDKPVIGVSWEDAIAFCQSLSEQTGKEYRLPSEAEWEYACRAGTPTPFYCGEMITTEVANYNGRSFNDGPEGSDRNQTTPVIEFGHANGFGLSDMHGNVREWCLDHWHDDYDSAPSDGRAWIEGGDSNRRVSRGGSWDDFPRVCRSAYRYYDTPVFQDDYLGFRVVLAPR